MMIWTNMKPWHPGWYWYNGARGPECLNIAEMHGEMWHLPLDCADKAIPVREMAGMWGFEPIKQPGDNN